MFIGFMLLLVIVGDGIIYLIFGPGAALFGLACIAAGAAPLILIWAALYLIEWIARRADES